MAEPPFSLPAPPLKEWERADKLNIELIGYGWAEKRVMVRLHLPKDRDMDRIQLAVALMGRDIKHSKHWLCEFCGAPARETHFQNLSWHHLDPPRLIIYIHFVCDMDKAHVRAGLTTSHNMLNLAQGGAMGPMPSFDTFGQRPAGVAYPLAGSCGHCQRDETAGAGAGMMRCSGCKMTRYCGAECQKKDWKRHKVSCGMVYTVSFENWD
ncbi:uncharacterized protein TRAVEDRAFT_39272 [Trametes versicolor FP-101664 SS1]|uniref:uncharacterized protein n=1 Tax=Trametes versicolor (strain FP-101664) TaxID=717944 RepID=UPI00046227EF|nr:uncharacterized protein TRAVEDRAFT_39272 [Trametes versicolor FP-101664 SS1]EIW54764.1 hypothetical protein TRAVEDRAFT_39272 [Trametes versicolor FP-101664 SS1]